VEPVEAPPPPQPADVPAFAVKLSDDAVFALRATLGGKAPEVRAREASEQLKRAYEGETTSDVSIARRGDSALLGDSHQAGLQSPARGHRQERVFVFAGRLLRAHRVLSDPQAR
jgi:hypothetical protein